MIRVKALLFAALMMTMPVLVHAEPLQVHTDQDTYSYGDLLSFTVTVPTVTQQTAAFRIIDEAGMESSTIAMAISEESTVLTAAHPFMSSQFKTGTYVIEVEYDGSIASTTFNLTDSGRIIIPFWIKDVAGLWVEGIIDDVGFFRNLVDNEIITIDQTLDDNANIMIPSWYKTGAELWRNGGLSDDEFASGLQYLVRINVIVIG